MKSIQKITCAFCIISCLLTKDAIGQKKSWLGFSPLSDTVPTEKKGLFILPLLYYTPDTRWAYGGAGVYYFSLEAKNANEQKTRMSYIQFLADYTQNKQTDVWSVWNIFTRNENYLVKGELRYRNFPDKFYGIGNNTKPEWEEKYSYDLISLKKLLLKKIKKGLFLGIDYHFEYEYNFKHTEGGILEKGDIVGYNGAVGSAIGLVGVLDTRDNIINPFRGKLIEISSYAYTSFIGSTYRFYVINGLYQNYWRLYKKNILAWQNKIRLSIGNVPFLDLSTLGNEDILRGYAKNRFRDHHFIGTQVEYRFPLFWRLGAVAFTGIGDVFNNIKDLQIKHLKYSIGTGIRFAIKPADRLNLRIDYGYGKEGGYFYFMLTESF